jgi:hypothetical protein
MQEAIKREASRIKRAEGWYKVRVVRVPLTSEDSTTKK